MMDYKVDYHIHTTYSDGAYKPVEIVKMRKEEGYDIIAITDHDGVDGVQEALTAGEAIEMKVVPGVEISTVTDNGIEIHVLGYNIDIENEKLLSTLKELRDRRADRNERLLKAFQDMGYEITMEDVIARPKQTYFGKPHFANALVKKGYAKDKKDAFDTIFENPEIKAIKKVKLSTKEAIDLILEAGGMPVIAHPAEIKGLGALQSEEWKQNIAGLLKELKISGLKGIEVFHPSAGKAEEDYFISMANKYHLHMTEGSDFHE